MAQPKSAIQPARENSPAITVGTPNDGIREMFDSLARRAFEIFESNGHMVGRDMDDWLQAEREMFHTAHIDLSETENGFTVRAEVPGFATNELEINVEGRQLTISGKREKSEERKDKENKRVVYSERCADQILRVVELPADVRADETKATLKDGILEMEIPKAAPARKIAIAAKTA